MRIVFAEPGWGEWSGEDGALLGAWAGLWAGGVDDLVVASGLAVVGPVDDLVEEPDPTCRLASGLAVVGPVVGYVRSPEGPFELDVVVVTDLGSLLFC